MALELYRRKQQEVDEAALEATKSKTQTKILSADVTTTGVISDLTYSALKLNTVYSIKPQFRFDSVDATVNSKQIIITVYNGANVVGHIEHYLVDISRTWGSKGHTIEFEATSPNLTFDFSTRARINILGNGTKEETYVTVSELNNIEETTEYS